MDTKKTVTLFFLMIFFISAMKATDYYVNALSGSDTNDGLTKATAFKSIDKVFGAQFSDGDVIYLSGEFVYAKGKRVEKSISIKGEDKSPTIIKGIAGAQNNFMVIGGRNSRPQVTIEHVIFKDFDNYNENASNAGGVLYINPGAGLTCRDVKFINNQSYMGGAVSAFGGNITFENCYFGYNRSLIRPEAKSADGGAINASVSDPNDLIITVNRCLFEGNSTENSGAALRIRTASMKPISVLVQNSTFTNNITKESGSDYGTVLIQVQNVIQESDIKFINNTIAYNKTERKDKRAVAGLSIVGQAENVSLINNIIFANTNANGVSRSLLSLTNSPLKESRNNLSDLDNRSFDFDKRTAAGKSSGNLTGIKAEQLQLATALSDNGGATHTLSIGNKSVAVDAGYTEKTPETDQRNYSRSRKPDIGAYEASGKK